MAFSLNPKSPVTQINIKYSKHVRCMLKRLHEFPLLIILIATMTTKKMRPIYEIQKHTTTDTEKEREKQRVAIMCEPNQLHIKSNR